MASAKVDIRKLKEFAFNELTMKCSLKEILLSESDELEVQTFLARLPIWLRLGRLAFREARNHQPRFTVSDSE